MLENVSHHLGSQTLCSAAQVSEPPSTAFSGNGTGTLMICTAMAYIFLEASHSGKSHQTW